MKQFLTICFIITCQIAWGQNNIVIGAIDSSFRIIPIDTTIDATYESNGVIFPLDIDGDGLIDLNLKIYRYHHASSGSDEMRLYFSDTNTFIFKANYTEYIGECKATTMQTSSNDSPVRYDYGDLLVDTNDITNGSSYLVNVSISYEPVCYYWSNLTYWLDNQIHYIGFKKIIYEDTLLGWIKIRVSDLSVIHLYEVVIQNSLVDIPETHSTPYTIISVDYFDLLGKKILKPKKGMFIERKITNKGIFSTKYYIQ